VVTADTEAVQSFDIITNTASATSHRTTALLQKLVSWSLTSLFSTNMAISETTLLQERNLTCPNIVSLEDNVTFIHNKINDVQLYKYSYCQHSHSVPFSALTLMVRRQEEHPAYKKPAQQIPMICFWETSLTRTNSR